jgi:hypothetical protein
VTTPNPQFLTGVWLNAGDKLLQIDDTKAIEAEIDIPQSDIDLIKLGAEVRLRPWSEGNREIVGRVTELAPTAVDEVDNDKADSKVVAGTLPRRATTRHEPAPTAVDEVDNDKADNNVVAGTSLPRAVARHALAQTDVDKPNNSGVVRVKASVANARTFLRPGMTGYAKINGLDMTVWEAYLRLFIRFFNVELWSWVP